MNDATLDAISKLPTEQMSALEISGNFWRYRRNWKAYREVWYPDFDLNNDEILAQNFDIVIIEQVLEHVRYPYRAVRKIHRMLNRGGWLLVTTPFLIQIHMDQDYTRWTASGMRYLLEEGGFVSGDISTDQWGNRKCLIEDLNSCADGRGWTVFEEDRHSLMNEPEYPVVVWAIAQKN